MTAERRASGITARAKDCRDVLKRVDSPWLRISWDAGNISYYEGIYPDPDLPDLAPKVMERFPQAVFFGGQLVFPHETFITRWLHNYAVFALQRKFYQQGFPFLILPIRV